MRSYLCQRGCFHPGQLPPSPFAEDCPSVSAKSPMYPWVSDQESWLSHFQLACLQAPPREYGLGSGLKGSPVTYVTWEPPRPAAAGSCLHFPALLQERA